jgi:hypothetical protein
MSLQDKNLTPLSLSSLVATLCNSLQAVAIHFVKTLTVLVVCLISFFFYTAHFIFASFRKCL